MQANYKSNINEVHFVRADKHLFSRIYDTKIYRDEFGAPSTYRDWVPEPIVKQIIFEITGSRDLAEATKVFQFENWEIYNSDKSKRTTGALMINMNEIMNK